MVTTSVYVRTGFAVGGVPKPWIPLALSAGLWVALFALGRESLQVLSLISS